MRSYENLGTNPYNDNYRSESRGSARNYYSGEYDPSNRMRSSYGSESSGRSDSSRMGGFGSGRDTHASSGYGGTSSYGRSAGSSNYGSGSGSSNYGSGSSNYGSGSSNYGSGSNYGSSSNRRYGSSDWDSSNRYGDRDAWDRGTDEVKSWFGDDDAERRRRRDEMRDRSNDRYSSNRSYGSSSNYGSGSSNYGSGSSNYGTGSSYGSGYGSGSGSGYGSSNYGSSSNRYSSDWDRNRDRDHDDDRGFFDRAGDEIKSWFGDEEAERRRRMDEMHEREHDRDYNARQRTHTSYGNTYSGPPYSYGSSSRRDYEW